MDITEGTKERYFVMGPENSWSRSDYWFYLVRDGIITLIDKDGKTVKGYEQRYDARNFGAFPKDYKEITKAELPFYL